jgi:CBS domain containing-hemolysin-like protein
MFREGHNMGLLEPVQLALAQNFFDMVEKTLEQVLIPLSRVVSVTTTTSVAEAIEVARRHQLSSLPVVDQAGKLTGYVSAEDLLLESPGSPLTIFQPFISIPVHHSLAKSLLEMRANEAELALVVDEHQQVRGLLSAQRLYEQLFTGALVRFRK